MWLQTPTRTFLPQRELIGFAGAGAWLLACFFSILISSAACAQSASAESEPPRATASRAEIDSLAARAAATADGPGITEDRRETLRRYAADLRARLRDGDFQPGDRIIVVTRGDSISVDTLAVQPDRSLGFRNLPPIPLTGVLRSELPSYLGEQLRQYVKRDVLRADPLVRVGILGEVVHPGYYRVPLAISIGDALMIAGGPTPQSDLTRVQIRRGRKILVSPPGTRSAMVRGESLSELGIDAGDEIVLTPIPTRNWLLITQLGGLATGLVLTLKAFKAF